MRRSNVLVIFRREVRDQLRDRRTLFMIFVLPVLLYPLLGMGIVQFAAAFEQKPRTVLLVGVEHLPEAPALLNAARDTFDPSLFDSPAEAARLKVTAVADAPPYAKPEARFEAIRGGLADAAVVIPADVKAQLNGVVSSRIPVVYDSADERSQITHLRVREVIARWNERIVAGRLARDNKPAGYTEPIQAKAEDVATPAEAGGSIWAKVFPFLMVMMALTGAYYPAVDLCAGEKERGTMETLLISPATRAEIVMGKFLTVVLASIATVLLNLASLALTGFQLARQVGAMSTGPGAGRLARIIGPPSLESAFWMLLLVIPLSVFFGAICLALAVLARSMKEGQYYMTPVFMIVMPLVFLTLAPGIELNLFYSLVPVTGVSLLLKTLMQGEYGLARAYFLPVLVPTAIYGAVALRWAVEQFKSEEVLFRESERFEVGPYLRHLVRDRGLLPTGGQALACFMVMIVAAWFVMLAMSASTSVGNSTAATMGLSQVAFLLTPALAMSVVLTSSPGRTLRLRWPTWRYLAIAVGLALAVNPLVREFGTLVEHLFPIPEATKAVLAKLLGGQLGLGVTLVAFALVPAVCEEVAFRGFILSGLESGHTTRSAVFYSSFLFAALHVLMSLYQQFFNAALLGIVLGYLAVRSRSLLPGVIFHAINNGLAVVIGWPGFEAPGWLFRDTANRLFAAPWLVLASLASVALLWALFRAEPDPPAIDGVSPS